MESTKQPQIKNRQKMYVSSLSLDKDDLRRFCNILQERANSAAELEVDLFPRDDQTDEQYEANLQTLRESSQLKVNVSGKDGEELWGSIDEVFESVNFPEQVNSFYVDSETTLKYIHNYYPHNSFKILLDFNKPKIFDLSLMPSHGTPNASNVEVQGYDATWVNGLFSEIKKFIDNRSSSLSFVHHHSIYDILVWLFGLPLSFWFCSKLAASIESAFGGNNAFVISALYLYVFLVSLFVFRLLFHYLRWVCPLVEWRSKGSRLLTHRAILAVMSVGWFGQFLYDIVKWLVKL